MKKISIVLYSKVILSDYFYIATFKKIMFVFFLETLVWQGKLYLARGPYCVPRTGDITVPHTLNPEAAGHSVIEHC